MTEREIDLTPAIERFEEIQELAPQRSIYWALQNLVNEANELLVTDPSIDIRELKKEAADVQIALWKVLLSAGILRADFYERDMIDKEEVILDRMKDAYILSRGGSMSWDTAYKNIKSLEK